MWEHVFQPACDHFGLTPIRADKIHDSGEIPDQIFTYLRDAEVVIADVSNANPNVMYELGLRHTRDGLTLQVGEYGRLPFDVGTIRTIQFNRTEAGLIAARDELIESLRAGLQGRGTPLRVRSIWAEAVATPQAEVLADASASRIEDDPWEDAEPGTMDILAEGEAAIQHVGQVFTQMTATMGVVNAVVQEHTAATQESDAQNGGFAGRLRVARSLADGLAEPAAVLEEQANSLVNDLQSLSPMVDYLVARTRSETDAAELAALQSTLGSVLQMIKMSDETSVGITNFRGSIRGLRSFSKDLRPQIEVLDRAATRILEGLGIISGWRIGIEEVLPALES